MGLFKFFKKGDKNNVQSGTLKKKNEEEKQLKVEQNVDDYFAYLLTIYNDYVDQYNKNKAIRELINKKTEVEAYVRNIDNGIRLTKKAFEQINTAPYVYEVPKSIQQYMSACKKQFLLNLEHNLKRDEVIKNLLLERKESNQETIDHANELLAKADQHLNFAKNYMEKARKDVFGS